MNSEYIRKNLTIEDLNENQQTLYEAIGKDKYLGLCHEVGGFQVYFPKENTLYSIVLKKIKHSENTGRERSFHTMNSNTDNILENLTVDDLGENQKLLFEILGKETYIEVCRMFGGGQICIPLEETLRRNIIKRKILEKKELFQSGKITKEQLARMYNVSVTFVYWIMRGKK